MMNTNTYKLSDNELENVNGGGLTEDILKLIRYAIEKRFYKKAETTEAEVTAAPVEPTVCYLR